MSELQDKLNAILGDPGAMGQIMALAQSLGAPSAEPEPPPPSPPAQPDLSALLGALTGDGGSARLLPLLSRIMEESGKDDNRRIALLQALRPFVREQRYAKLDKAIQIARLSHMIRIGLEVLKGGNAEDV